MEDKEKDIENQNQLNESDMDLLGDSDIFGDDALNVSANLSENIETTEEIETTEAAQEVDEDGVPVVQKVAEIENETAEQESELTEETIEKETIEEVIKEEVIDEKTSEEAIEEIEAFEETFKESQIIETEEPQVQIAQPIISEESVGEIETSNELVTVRPIKFQNFENITTNESIKRNLDIMQDISMHISVELGKAKSTIKEVMDIKKGSIIELTKIAGEQVEVYINDKYVAKGEVIVIEDKFGIRVTNTNVQQKI